MHLHIFKKALNIEAPKSENELPFFELFGRPNGRQIAQNEVKMTEKGGFWALFGSIWVILGHFGLFFRCNW